MSAPIARIDRDPTQAIFGPGDNCHPADAGDADDFGGSGEEWKPERLSQQANAERLVRELDGGARFHVGRGEWQVYRQSEGRFVPDETGEVDRAAKRVARQTWALVEDPPDGNRRAAVRHAVESERAAGVAAMMTLARTEPGLSVPAREFDANGMLLNLLNGTVDLRTGELRPHRRDDLLTKLAPVAFDPAADCPLWMRFLDRVMAGNAGMIRYLSRLAGLCLTADATVQELWIPWGGGANGKSVFFDTLCGLMGNYAGAAADSLVTTRSGDAEHPTEVADLCGRRLVIASETEAGAKLRIQLVKRLTGNATIKARFMRQDYFEFPRTHKLILITNNKPQIGETTDATWRRVRLIPFTVTIPPQERDPGLLEKLRAEWPGILNWCLAGCMDWRADGMQTPSEVMVATTEYQAEQDPVSEFVEERCTLAAGVDCCRSVLFATYTEWAKAAGVDPLPRTGFYERIRRVPGVEETMRRRDGRPVRIFTGVGLARLADLYAPNQGVTP